MLEYAMSFYENYTIIFYSLAVVAVILEWPITVLAISTFLAPKYGISFIWIFILAFIWDFVWDLMHFYIWKFGKGIHKKLEENKKFWKVIKKIDSYSYFDKLVVIKYTPPITSAWLIYIWASKTKVLEFIQKDWFLCILSATIVSVIWYFLWKWLEKDADIWKILLIIWIWIILVYFISKIIFSKIIKKIENNNIKND